METPDDDLDSIWNDFNSSLNLNVTENDQFEKKLCKNCNSDESNFIITEGDITCRCGFVQDSRIVSEGPEWNNYTEDGVINGSGIRCGTILDSTNPYDTGNTFIPKYHWSWHLDENGVKRYTNLSKIK